MKAVRRKIKGSMSTVEWRAQSGHARKCKRFITPAEARKIAARSVAAQIFKGAEVKDGAKAKLSIYIRNEKWRAEDVWVVYKNCEPNIFKSSEVVLVSKHTGIVLYEGSTGDEG